jgi:hypothetical protein
LGLPPHNISPPRARVGHARTVVSQASRRLVRVCPIPDDDTRVEATIELRCGCTVTLPISPDRVLQRPDGTDFAVGKYPCPLGHPAQ